MKITLTQQEAIHAVINYLKEHKHINAETDFIGKIERYSEDKFLVITEFKPQAEEGAEE